jgi:hypothetical protein
MKKFLKISGISLLSVFIILLALPFLFKGKIIQSLKEETNKSINAKVNFSDDIGLSLIKSFPKLQLDIRQLSIVGVDTFKNDTLAYLPELSITMNLMSVIKGDKITSYLLLATSLDGSMATTAKTTSVRTVCSNTLTMALNEKSVNMIKVPHSTEFNVNRAKLNLDLIDESQEQFIANMRRLASVEVPPKDVRKIYNGLFFNPEVSAQDQHGIVIKKIDDIVDLYNHGAGSNFGSGTMYNVLQGVTDFYSNNIKSRTESAKFWHSFYGNAEKIKLQTQQKLLEMV